MAEIIIPAGAAPTDGTTLYAADGRAVVHLPISVAQIVDRCDSTLRSLGMQMQIVCETCHGAGRPDYYVKGDNQRGATVFLMTCRCTRRICGA